MSLFTEEGLLTETQRQVSVSENLIRAHTVLVQRPAVILVGILKDVQFSLYALQQLRDECSEKKA